MKNNISIQLPDSLYKSLHELAQKEGISIEQFITTALAEKISTTETYLEELAKKGDRTVYESILAKVPDIEPETYDLL